MRIVVIVAFVSNFFIAGAFGAELEGFCMRDIANIMQQIEHVQKNYLSEDDGGRSIFKAPYSAAIMAQYMNEVYGIDFAISIANCSPQTIYLLRQIIYPGFSVIKQIREAIYRAPNESPENRIHALLEIANAIYPKLHNQVKAPYFKLSDLFPDGEEDDMEVCFRIISSEDLKEQAVWFEKLSEICASPNRAIHMLEQMRALVVNAMGQRLASFIKGLENGDIGK